MVRYSVGIVFVFLIVHYDGLSHRVQSVNRVGFGFGVVHGRVLSSPRAGAGWGWLDAVSYLVGQLAAVDFDFEFVDGLADCVRTSLVVATCNVDFFQLGDFVSDFGFGHCFAPVVGCVSHVY